MISRDLSDRRTRTASSASVSALRQDDIPAAELPGIDRSRIRYLIISEGRTGSTLLAAILGAAGGDLGSPVQTEWDPTGGANELAGLVPVNIALERAKYFWDLTRHVPLVRPLARFFGSLARRRVRKLVSQAQFLKCPVAAIPYIFKMRYIPRIIIVYRDFGQIARGKLLMQHMTCPDVVDDLRDCYRNALVALHTFGGCAISYDELTDPASTGWIDSLSQCTGLSREALSMARAKIARASSAPRESSFQLDTELDHMHRDLRALAGRYIPPSPQYVSRHLAVKGAPAKAERPALSLARMQPS